VQLPRIDERLVDVFEVPPADRETPSHDVDRHIVPTLENSSGHPRQRQLDVWQL
jgi:hypothetical protein